MSDSASRSGIELDCIVEGKYLDDPDQLISPCPFSVRGQLMKRLPKIMDIKNSPEAIFFVIFSQLGNLGICIPLRLFVAFHKPLVA